ncbi:MAG: ABC transporter ATP-binding protein [Armatimonadota bacterium]|nr:ABC transporter ATP-binding protein [Armatimonadota bacterium]MDR5704261.1 ABC transporter ATP-binding protein [Armatimonadota bacterium]
MNALEIRNLTVSYGNSPVLEDLSLEIPEGSFVSLVGPSGCGKSTLLRTIAGLLSPMEGEIYLFGRAVNGPSPDVGFLFQEDALLPWRTVAENVALGLRFRGLPNEYVARTVEEWLRRVGLLAFRDSYPHELSGGMKKRASLAQVLAPRPRILLMDEPFASLDAIVRNILEADFLNLVREEGLTALLVTHDLEEAIVLSEQVALMSAGPSARIRRIYKVPFPYPRDLVQVKGDPAFGRLLQQIWSDLQEEVSRMGWEVVRH